MTPSLQESDDRSSDPLLGQMIGERYRVTGVLGDGGTGTVYRAEHVLMEKQIALKVLHPTHAVISSAMDRFQKEAIALAKIEHPNVVSATDFGKLKNGSFYLALEFIDGASLGEVLATEGALPVGRACNIAIQICRALVAAHKENIIHRDLKPHNVMLVQQPGGELVKVLDFGLAKLRYRSGDESQHTSTQQVFGTPHYMAPEQITGSCPVDGRTDLYALGVLLYEMCCGTRPFDSKDIPEVLGMQVASVAAPLPESIHPSLRQLIVQLMNKQPEARPESAMETLSRLSAIAQPPSLEDPPAWWDRQWVIANRSVPSWALGLPLLVFLIIFMIGLGQRDATEPSTAQQTEQSSPPDGPAATDDPATPDKLIPTLSAAEFGKEEAIASLLEMAPKDRSREVWHVLAQGRIAQKRWKDALGLYQQAVRALPQLKEDEQLAKNVRLAATIPGTAELAVQTAGDFLGRRGADVLFSVWSETKKRTPETALAGRYLETPEVFERASPALQLALRLRREEACDELRALLTAAVEYGDTRSVRPMIGIRGRATCRNPKTCLSCLKGSAQPQEAITAAGKRKGPRY